MHSPGPWAVITTTNSRGQELPPKIIQDGQKGGGFIAQLGITGSGKREDNAQLIAAAPDLLAALETLATEFGNAVPGTHEDKLRTLARNAINKATCPL